MMYHRISVGGRWSGFPRFIHFTHYRNHVTDVQGDEEEILHDFRKQKGKRSVVKDLTSSPPQFPTLV